MLQDIQLNLKEMISYLFKEVSTTFKDMPKLNLNLI